MSISEEDVEKIIFNVASILDHPSVYMGGPSHGNMRRAKTILGYLERNYEVKSKVERKP